MLHEHQDAKRIQINPAEEMEDPLRDCSPLINAASSGKLRLVRLLVEGGAQVNGRNPRGETALLAACKALRGEPAGPEAVKLLRYLLQNEADPNARDHAGRTPLMYACLQRAGVQVAQTLLAAGADACMEDLSGASALVYAINAQHQPTVQVLMDACRARGRDIIIIATEMGVNGNPVTRRYLNVPPSPDSSLVSCMSPSDVILKTGSPNSSEEENIFNFKGASRHGSGSSSRRSSCELSPLSQRRSLNSRPRISSEPWLAIQNLASLNRTYEEGVRERRQKEEGDGWGLRMEKGGSKEDKDEEQRSEVWRREDPCSEDSYLRVSLSVVSLTDTNEKLPFCSSFSSQLRRNTLPSLTVVPPPLHLPSIMNQSDSHLQVPGHVSPFKAAVVFQPHPPRSPALLPPLSSSLVAPPACCYSERSRRPLRRHLVQLDPIRGAHLDL